MGSSDIQSLADIDRGGQKKEVGLDTGLKSCATTPARGV
jgi:hypothetical protein